MSVSDGGWRVPERLLLRLEVEEFLVEEAALLDEWRLDEWLALFTEDATYVVPSTDLPDGDPSQRPDADRRRPPAADVARAAARRAATRTASSRGRARAG